MNFKEFFNYIFKYVSDIHIIKAIKSQVFCDFSNPNVETFIWET